MAFNVQDDIDNNLLKSISKVVYKTVVSSSWFTSSKSYNLIFRIYSIKSGSLTIGKAMIFHIDDLNKLSVYRHVIKPFNLITFNDFYSIEYPVIIYLKFVYTDNNK